MLMASCAVFRPTGGPAVSSIQLAMDLAAPERPGRLVGAMVAQIALVGGVVWLIVWAVRNARRPRPPQNPYPPAYYQQYRPEAPWPYPPPPAGHPWPPQAAPPYPPPGWPQQPPLPYPPHGGPPTGTR